MPGSVRGRGRDLATGGGCPDWRGRGREREGEGEGGRERGGEGRGGRRSERACSAAPPPFLSLLPFSKNCSFTSRAAGSDSPSACSYGSSRQIHSSLSDNPTTTSAVQKQDHSHKSLRIIPYTIDYRGIFPPNTRTKDYSKGWLH